MNNKCNFSILINGMYKLILMTVLYPLVLIFFLTSCSKDENTNESTNNKPTNTTYTNLTQVTWKCVGFGTDGKVVELIKPLQTDASYLHILWEKIYVISFAGDGSFKGYATKHDLTGTYSINGNTILIQFVMSPEKVAEFGEGERFCEALYKSSRYEITNNQLKLYYDNNEYLLFNPMKPGNRGRFSMIHF